jgi:hypothetical protein
VSKLEQAKDTELAFPRQSVAVSGAEFGWAYDIKATPVSLMSCVKRCISGNFRQYLSLSDPAVGGRTLLPLAKLLVVVTFLLPDRFRRSAADLITTSSTDASTGTTRNPSRGRRDLTGWGFLFVQTTAHLPAAPAS